MFALSLPALLLSGGLALDVARLTSARNALQNSIDAAVLAASKLKDTDGTRETYFDEYLAASLGSEGTLSNITSDFDAEIGVNYIASTGTVSADVELAIMHIFGQSARVTVQSSAYESTEALEVVMVLDNTGSMAGSRTQALRDAAHELAKILESVSAQNPNRSIRVGLVPFATAVNIKGTGFRDAWIDRDGGSAFHGINFEQSLNGGWPIDGNTDPDAARTMSPTSHLALFERTGIAWKGCVEARPSTVDVDAAPNAANPDTLFVPYFAPDEPDIDYKNGGSVSKSVGDDRNAGNDSNKLNNNYLADRFPGNLSSYATDKDKHFALQRSLAKYAASNVVRSRIVEGQPLTSGPNRACPTPVVPLTDDFTMLKAEILKMIHWNGSGTNVAEGLAWGTRVLSPGEPYTEGDPFGSERTKKIVVLLTDGENTVFGASKSYNLSDYGSYGFMANGRFNGKTSQSAAARVVDGWVEANCAMLDRNEVEIFTIVLQADTAANRALYSKCATTPANYFPTNDVTQLKEVFSRIGTIIADLHLTQ